MELTHSLYFPFAKQQMSSSTAEPKAEGSTMELKNDIEGMSPKESENKEKSTKPQQTTKNKPQNNNNNNTNNSKSNTTAQSLSRTFVATTDFGQLAIPNLGPKNEYLKDLEKLFPLFFKKLDLSKALVFIDTNVLLNLFLWPDSDQLNFRTLLHNVRVVIPFYVLQEFISNWPAVEERGRLDLSNKIDEVSRQLGLEKKKVEELQNTWQEVVQKRKKDIHDWVFNRYSNFSDSRFQYNEELYLTKEGFQRYASQIPPGFKDYKKEENKYGDFFIWAKIIQISKAILQPEDCYVVFLSNDVKEDWCNAEREIRKDLQDEFYGAIGRNVGLLKFTGETFLQITSGVSKPKVSFEAVLKENTSLREKVRDLTERNNYLETEVQHAYFEAKYRPTGATGTYYAPTGSQGPTGATGANYAPTGAYYAPTGSQGPRN